MRNLITATVVATLHLATASLTAQGVLTTTFADNNGNGAGGIVYFDLDVTAAAGLLINTIDINTTSTAGAIDVYLTPTTYVGNEVSPGAWTLAASGTFAAGAGAGIPTPVPLNGGLALPQGQYGVAIAQGPNTDQRYTTGNAPFQLVYTTPNVTLTAGAAQNAHFTGIPFQPRVWNGTLHYGCVTCASKSTYGAGCTHAIDSFYELMTSIAFDLTNTDIVATKTTPGYSVTASAGSGILPVGGVDPAGGTVLVLGDDDQVAVGTLGMTVGSNGWFALGSGNSNSFTPTAQVMLNNPAEAVYTWTDLQPNNSGVVTYEEDAVTGLARVTFDGVHGWNTPDDVFIQIDFNTVSGDWAIRFGTVGFNNPEDWLVGYSPAGVSPDVGSLDISATGTFTTTATSGPPMAIDSTLPQLGTTWTITTTNIDPTSPFAVTMFGPRGPATPLATLGLPASNCELHLTALLTSAASTNSFGTSSVSVPIPFLPALTGFLVSAQSVCLTQSNSANLLTSNGVQGKVGF